MNRKLKKSTKKTKNLNEGKQPSSSLDHSTSFKTKLTYTLFLLSGFTALIYEVTWLSRIQLIMGHTVYSLATTLTAYMVGLALGALYAPRILRSGISGLWLYLIAELLIGLYGIAFFPLLKILDIPYSLVIDGLNPDLKTMSLIQFIFCGFLIVVPTFLMGTTLPLLAHFLFKGKNELSVRLPSLYSCNTFGAFLGAISTGFYILPNFGYQKSIFLAAAINISLIPLALSFLKEEKSPSLSQLKAGLKKFLKTKSKSIRFNQNDTLACFVLFISGLVATMTQVTWVRLGAMIFSPSTYNFPLVLSIALLGITIGSLVYRKLSTDISKTRNLLLHLPFIGGFLFLVGNQLLIQSALLIPYWHQELKVAFFGYSVLSWVTMSACVLPGSIIIGMLFPSGISSLTWNKENPSEYLGYGYMLNILGLAIGGIVGSFVLLPSFGLEFLATSIFVILAITTLIQFVFNQNRWIEAFALAMVLALIVSVFPKHEKRILTAGLFYNRNVNLDPVSLKSMGHRGIASYLDGSGAKLVDYEDDPHATISIHELRNKKGHRFFRINGKTDGSNQGDMRTTKLLSFFPLLAKSDAESVITIGLGIGSTVAETLRYPRLKETSVVELSKSMVKFSKNYFSEHTEDLYGNPKFRLINRDGRQYLRHTKKKFDVIISEPSNPWLDGVGSLFTKEYYELVAKRLNPDGVAMLWFHTYGLDCESVASVLLSAAESFKSILVFKVKGDLYILAGHKDLSERIQPIRKSSLEIEEEFFDLAKIGSKGLRAAGPESLFRKYEKLLNSTLITDRYGVLKAFSDYEPNLDDNQILQYNSGKTFFSGMSCRNYLAQIKDKSLAFDIGLKLFPKIIYQKNN